MLKRLLRHPRSQAALAWLLGCYLAFAYRTTRWRLVGAEHAAPQIAGAPAIIAFWHERLPMIPMLWRLARQRPEARLAGKRVHVLVSRHRDGQFIGAVIRRFDLAITSGSSSRGGAAGLRALAGQLAGGDYIAITPDGPRGPARHAARGVARLAGLAGVPVLACAARSTRCWRLNSWDRMLIPLPFGRGIVCCVPPIMVANADWAASLPAIEAALTDAADLADRLCRRADAVNALLAGWHTALRLAAPALRVALRIRAWRGKEIAARLPERRGIAVSPRPAGQLIWLHAASMGEATSLLPVLSALARRAPGVHTLLTTGTATSAALLEHRLPALGVQLRVSHQFVPLDVPQWVARFLDHWQPDTAGFVESELWPNLLVACRAREIPITLINARLSPRSFARWRRAPKLARAMLEHVADIQAQSGADAARFRALGARTVSMPGNLKYAAPPLPVDQVELAHWQAALAGRPIWLAASVHPEELDALLATHRLLAAAHPNLLSILVPRHPERGAAIDAQISGGRGSAIVARRRAAGAGPPKGGGIWIADTLGELGLFYRLAPIVFIGRSLAAPGGGQNPLEPARLGCAVAAGPHMDNFAEVAASLHEAGALARVADAAGLATWVDALLRAPARRDAAGQAARAACDRLDGLPDQIAASLLATLAASRTGTTQRGLG